MIKIIKYCERYLKTKTVKMRNTYYSIISKIFLHFKNKIYMKLYTQLLLLTILNEHCIADVNFLLCVPLTRGTMNDEQ